MLPPGLCLRGAGTGECCWDSPSFLSVPAQTDPGRKHGVTSEGSVVQHLSPWLLVSGPSLLGVQRERQEQTDAFLHVYSVFHMINKLFPHTPPQCRGPRASRGERAELLPSLPAAVSAGKRLEQCSEVPLSLTPGYKWFQLSVKEKNTLGGNSSFPGKKSWTPGRETARETENMTVFTKCAV